MNPNQAYYSSNNRGPNRGRRVLFIIGGIFVALLLIVAIIVGRTTDKNTGGGTPSENTSEDGGGNTLSLANAPEFSLVAPKDMKGYSKGSNLVDNVGDYTTTNNGCGLQFGVVDSEALPGSSIESMAAALLGTTADTGAVAEDPVDKGNLTLKDSSSADKYTLPTIELTYARNNVNYIARFSAVIIKGNSRAYVRTYCSNENGSVSSSEFKKVNDKAKEITVKTVQ
ncbi:MAG TPA: hypothetical protein VLA92_04270 [Candidatus Saccharimonadales bacterium]|nr:hypothetical protein [Candidatus Saccharimonadales bacterium]